MYSHKQSGLTMVIILMAFAALCILLSLYLIPKGEDLARKVSLIPAGVLLVMVLLFRDLTVSVDGETILVSFGIGLVKKRIAMKDVSNVKKVTNPWYTGWGIRMGPSYTLYNIAGRDAVELEFKSGGRKIRIGTDQPDELFDAINSRIQR